MKLFKVLLIYYVISVTKSQLSIPDELKECYKNNNIQNFHLPMNIRVLLDIIRKVEKNSYSTMDIRTMSSSMLHRLKFDGIEYYDNIQEHDGILPFGQSGTQNAKCKLIKKMVPGQPEIFPFDTLTSIERCTLHQAISNTIMKTNSHGMDSLCQQIGQKLTGEAIFDDLWNCPREYGVVLTPYGTIALGAIIGAIAASLQYQNVELNEMINTFGSVSTTENVDYSEQVDFIIPREEMIHEKSMAYSSLSSLTVKVDNVWLTTISGDLAEMIVYQGSIKGLDMELGATGFWNNTMRPHIYYLKDKHGYFDATRAEIIGDIDGLIIANNLQTWINDYNTYSIYSLRLSQILDMYYSDDGITLFNEKINVCNRKKTFSYAVPKTLLTEQTFAASYILAQHNGLIYTSREALKQMVDYAVNEFSVYTNDHLLMELLCRDNKYYPRVETLIVFDGSWSKEYTINFIAALIDDLDVSMYGSKMGIIHGTSGQWLLNVTSSPTSAYHAISNFTEISWPTDLNMITIFDTIYNYLNQTWKMKQQQHSIGSLGQVIVILAPSSQITEIEQQTTLKLLQKIKHYYPDLHFLYYVSTHNSHFFKPFLLSEQDHLTLNYNIDAIAQYLLTIPRILRPINISKITNGFSVFKDEIEGYISPSKSITYTLHPQYLINIKKIIITVNNFGYGTIKVCSWNQFKIHDNKENAVCRKLEEHKDITLKHNFECINTPCPYIYLRIQNATSLNKCAEIECKSPNEVRYIIRMQTYENSASKKIILNIFIITYLYLQIALYNI